jgi:glycosyltransferase involved in cell wall biosynthesis
MVFPSLFEGFGLPIIEALACGARVICSNISAMQELPTELISTFDPAHSHAIYESIETAVSSGSDRADARGGIEFASRFDWRETARKVLAVYRKVG